MLFKQSLFDKFCFSIHFRFVFVPMYHFSTHYVFVGLTYNSNKKVENDDQNDPLIQNPEGPNDGDHSPGGDWMELSCFAPKGVDRSI